LRRGIFSDRDDVSISLDFLRAGAAQMVCCGHAWNLYKLGPPTYLPQLGVILFFVISGFVIAHTLMTNVRQPDYGMIDFAIDRSARIMTALVPAVFLIAVLDFVAIRFGIDLGGGRRDLTTFVRGLVMYPFGPGTYGSGGHLTSVYIEFHIYLFVGALFFLFNGRNIAITLIVAILASRIPLDYFSPSPDGDRSLLVLWLLGFASYYVVGAVDVKALPRPLVFAAGVVLSIVFLSRYSFASLYNIYDYPVIVMAFTAFMLAAKGRHVITSAPVVRTVQAFAACSYSLYLTHYTIQQISS